MALKRIGTIEAGLRKTILIADASHAATWTGRMVGGHWFDFPLDDLPGRAVTWNDQTAVLATFSEPTASLVEVHRDGRALIVAASHWAYETEHDARPGALGRLAARDVIELGELAVPSGVFMLLDGCEAGQPRDLAKARERAVRFDGGIMLASDAPGYRVSYERVELGPRLGNRIRITPID